MGGVMNNFMDLIDGAERFGAHVERKQEEKNNRLGYDPHEALEDEYRGDQRLKALNSKMQREQDIDKLSKGIDPRGHKGEVALQKPKVSALDLFNTPHQFVMYSKPLNNKYKRLGY